MSLLVMMSPALQAASVEIHPLTDKVLKVKHQNYKALLLLEEEADQLTRMMR